MNKWALIFFFLSVTGVLQGQTRTDQSTVQLAIRYFNEGDYEKAAPLLKETYANTSNGQYFRMYVQCLTQLEQFDQAESELKKEIRKNRTSQPELLIHYGYVMKLQDREEEAQEIYDEAIQKIASNRSSYLNAYNYFIQWREYELAERVLIRGQEALKGETFYNELAQIYLYLRNYQKLMEVVLEMVRIDDENLPRAQSYLASALYADMRDSLRDGFRSLLLRRMQAEPDETGYNRLLVWFFLQEKQFTAALRQVMALDKRTESEDQQIFHLAQMALNNQDYKDASTAYEYLLSKGKEHPDWYQAFNLKMHADYLNFINSDPGTALPADKLARQFEEGLELAGFQPQNVLLIREYAHLLSFYLNEPEKAISVLEQGLKIPGLKSLNGGELKAEMADVYVFAGDPFEATLLYSQVIEANRDNKLGDEVKLKKARLAYFMGNFDYAKAQLDVLKASTSKLTANDALELALFIGNNSNLDTTEVPLLYFSRADLLFFRNRDSEALMVLDSIAALYPDHSLMDDVLFRKAKIEIRRKDYQAAVLLLEEIIRDYSYEMLTDNALYMVAETYQYNLKELEKASEAYKKILFDFPGSIYVPEARSRYRELTGEPSENPPIPESNKEEDFFHGNLTPGY